MFQRPNGSYTARVKGPDGKQHRVTGSTIAEVKTARAKLQTELANGSHFTESRTPFRVYALDWIDTYQGRTKTRIKADSKAAYRTALLAHAIPFFGSRPMCEIRSPDIKRFYKALSDRTVTAQRDGVSVRRSVSDSTVRLYMAPVKALFATAFEDGLIARNPCAGVRSVEVRDAEGDDDHGRTIRALTDEELARVIEAAPPDWRLLIELLAQTGLRIGEALCCPVARRGRRPAPCSATPVLRKNRQAQEQVRDAHHPPIARPRHGAVAGPEGRSVERRQRSRVLHDGSACG